MLQFLTILLYLFVFCTTIYAKPTTNIQGKWILEFSVQDNNSIPITCEVLNNKQIQIINHTEKIILKKIGKSKDTLIYEFPDFFSQLYIVWNKDKTAKGYFWNKNKKVKSTIPFKGHKTDESKFHRYANNELASTLSTRYKTTFSPNATQPEMAIGLFEQQGNYLSGTFLTETGDYRFLSGNVYGNQFFLSCLDGSHLFMFTGKIDNKNLQGTFYSGSNYSTDFVAQEDFNFELKDAYSLTYVKEESNAIRFQFPRLDGTTYSFPEDAAKNSITILQIMGTWCPNCIDESKYYLELYDKYKDNGLNIVVVGFEYSNLPAFHKERLELFKKRYKIPFEILIGGENSKKLSSEKFPFLNGIMSYPTSLFFNSKGELIKTHTGFSGPGTGEEFIKYKKEMEDFLNKELKL